MTTSKKPSNEVVQKAMEETNPPPVDDQKGDEASKFIEEATKPVVRALDKVLSHQLALSDSGRPGDPFTGRHSDPTEAREAFRKFLTNPQPTYKEARNIIKDGAKLVGSDDTERALFALSEAFTRTHNTQARLRL